MTFSLTEFDPHSSPERKTLQRQLFYALVEFEHKDKLEEFLTKSEVKAREVWVDDKGVSILHHAAANAASKAFCILTTFA